MLGGKPLPGLRPPRLAVLAAQISAALGGRPVNPDSPAQVLRALAADGIRVPSTRAQVLREVDHPAATLLLEYKELARLHAAHGWSWLEEWVTDGRFHPEFVVGGVVSGRWASRGGGALQIPRVLRRAVVADPGWVLVVADAAQLEPRVLAALAQDDARPPRQAPATSTRRWPTRSAATGQRQDRLAVRHVRRGGWAGAPAPGGAPAPVPARRPVRGTGRQGGGGGQGGPLAARPDLPAAVQRLAWPHRRAGRPGGRGAARGPLGARPRPVHPQLRGAGERGRLGRCLPGGPAAPPGASFAAIRYRRGARRPPAGASAWLPRTAAGRGWSSSSTTR